MAKAKQYEVVAEFIDLEDNKKHYQVGDTFPRPANKKVAAARIEELSSKANKQNKVLIKEV